MSEENFSSDFYDIIINIDSFYNLKSDKKGWDIEMTEKGLDNYEKYTQKEEIKLNRVGILGIGGVGKTYILGNIINEEKLKKKHITTKGISVIYPQEDGKYFVCLDSQGSEEPIIDLSTENEMSKKSEKERKKLVKEFASDKKFTEIFIQDFIIKHSNIFIVVVDQLSFSEQKLINRLKNEDFEKIFIIHNTQYLTDIKSIEEHIEDTVKKSVFSNLKKIIFTELELDTDKKKESKESTINNATKRPYYFREKNISGKNYDDNNKKTKDIIHLFMGKEGTEAGKFYNQMTIDFLKFQINQAAKKKKFDVIEEIKKFLSQMSVKYMLNNESKERPIKLDDISTGTKESKCIKLIENKDFKLKDCIIDEMGYSKFSENTITPAYVAYLGKYIKYKKDKEKKKN